jgi:DNA-binding NarL/FixJ family response regulator
MEEPMQQLVKLLLVEDDQVDTRAITGMLNASLAYSFALTHAASFEQSIQQLRRERFDIILLDLGLPDSFELETVANTLPQAHGTPIVVISGLEDREFAARARQQGAAEYLGKGSISTKTLEQTIGKVLAASRAPASGGGNNS